MPIDKFNILKRAAEINEINSRLALISDFHAAFSGDNEHPRSLEKIVKSIEGNLIFWESDPNWEERINRFKR